MFKLLILFTLCATVTSNGSPHVIEYFASLTATEIAEIPKSVIEDSLLDSVKLIEKYGYSSESHEVKTEDGYFLTLHRIPRGRNYDFDVKSKIPVLFVHGLLCSSAVWIVNGPEKSLGYILADEGYDVWLANSRGNFYSRNHETLNPNEPKYWKFSWNEIGYYDLPAMIDYILNVTNQDKLHLVGHSQGGTAFFVMAADRPEYNDKILSMQALGPAVYMSHLKSPLIKYLAPYAYTINIILSLIGMNEFLPSTEMNAAAAHMMCHQDSKLLPVCTNFLFLLSGYNPSQLNMTMLPVYMSHTPAGAASRQLIHYAQLYNSGRFRKYDYGSTLVNLYSYGSSSPPDYDLSKVTAPVALHYSDNDWCVGLEDIDKLHDELPNPIGKFRISMREFNHLDFIWAVNAPDLVYNKIIELLNEHNP